jgi:hypothetical protein
MIFHQYFQVYSLCSFPTSLVRIRERWGSPTHPADLNKVSRLGQFPSSSSIFMSLNAQVACVFLSAGPLHFPPRELKQGHCMILVHAVRSNCDRHPCQLLFRSS